MGTNLLRFQGTGTSDGYGLLIDNVELFEKGTVEQYVMYGDFTTVPIGADYPLGPERELEPYWSGRNFNLVSGYKYGLSQFNQAVELANRNQSGFIMLKLTFNDRYVFQPIPQ